MMTPRFLSILRVVSSVLASGSNCPGRKIALVILLCTSVRLAGGSQEPVTIDESSHVDAGSSVTFARMESDIVRTEVLSWLATTGRKATDVKSVAEQWANTELLSSMSGEELLDLTVATFAEADEGTRRLLEATRGEGVIEPLIFDGIRGTPFFRHQVSQLHARWMVQHRYYDQALNLIYDLQPEQVVDPAGLLFYRAVCQAELLQRRDALETISLLLNNTQDVPRRFRIVAEMLQQDLMGKKDEGMDLVERLMKDVERRLELGEAGDNTQQQGEAIIAALDKMLDDMDRQKNQQQGGGSGQGQGSQQQPGQMGASESEIREGSAEGIADRKKLSEEGSWGMLDRQAEARARELIRSKLPPNFLDQIGRFSRKLAEQK